MVEMLPAVSMVGCLSVAVVIEERAVVIGDVVGDQVWLLPYQRVQGLAKAC